MLSEETCFLPLLYVTVYFLNGGTKRKLLGALKYDEERGFADWQAQRNPSLVMTEDILASVSWSKVSDSQLRTIIPWQFRGLVPQSE